jgi:vitamin B12 transporter
MSIALPTHQRAVARALAFVSFVSFVSIASQADAQTSSNETVLPPVVVTASRIEQQQADALPHTTLITAEDIRNNPATDLPSLLRREAGLQFTQNGGPGQLTSLFIRGAQPSEVLILIDGVPVRRQGFSPMPALEHILPEQIDHIEIVRGNVSAIYGSSAVGGVVQIFTKQGAGPGSVSVSTEVGSRGTAQLTTGVSGKNGDTRYALSVTRFKTDGFSSNNTTQYPNENPDKNGDRNTSASLSISQEWIKGHEIGFRAYDNDGKNSYDGGGFGAPTDANFAHSKQQSFAAFFKDRFTSNWISNFTVSTTSTRNENINISAFPYTLRDNGDTNLLQWANEINLMPNLTLNAGADFGSEKLGAYSDFGFGVTQTAFNRSTSSVYTGLNGKFDVHQVQFNLRHDQVGGAGSDLTGLLGYGYLATDKIKLIANASTAFLAPNLTQLHDAISGNPDLKPETSKSFELGMQYVTGKTIARATYFNTWIKNQFAADPNECFSGSHLSSCPTFNVAKSSNHGVELSASGKLSDVDTRAALTFQQPRNDATGDILIRRARTLGSFSLAKAYGAWKLGSDVQYTGRRPDVDFVTTNKQKLSPYWLANFNARYEINQKLSAYGRIENAFDRNYQTAYGYNQPPRGLFVGLNWLP